VSQNSLPPDRLGARGREQEGQREWNKEHMQTSGRGWFVSARAADDTLTIEARGPGRQEAFFHLAELNLARPGPTSEERWQSNRRGFLCVMP